MQVTDEQIKKWEPLIHKMANKLLYGGHVKDPMVDIDDILQHGRMYVWEAYLQYDPTRSKMITFLHRKLFSKFCTLRKKYYRHSSRRVETDDASVLLDITAREEAFDEAVGEKMSIETLLGWLGPRRKTLFQEHFMEGRTISDIKSRHPEWSLRSIKDDIKILRRVKDEERECQTKKPKTTKTSSRSTESRYILPEQSFLATCLQLEFQFQ